MLKKIINLNALMCTLLLAICLPVFIYAQACAPITNFKAEQYNQDFAVFAWDNHSSALYYKFEVVINGALYQSVSLPAGSTVYDVGFNPPLVHHDHVEATLTRYCAGGATATARVDFIIIIDAVVYLTGDGPNDARQIEVEPVVAANANLVPGPIGNICGQCSANHFKLNSGFYGTFDIGVAPSLSHPIEDYQFKKAEFCNCLDNAIALGILSPNGGQGPNYAGTPYTCSLTMSRFGTVNCSTTHKRDDAQSPNEYTSIDFALSANPNPADMASQINFDLPADGKVTVVLSDILGASVASIIDNQWLIAGNHTVNVATGDLPTGLYFCTIDDGLHVQTIKMSIFHD
jgi:hypothetical protein